MSLFRLMSRDRVDDTEVRLYVADGFDPSVTAVSTPNDCQVVEFDTLNILDMAPYYLLLAAQDRAKEVVAQAQQEAEQLRNDAKTEGITAGREEVKQELLPSLTAFANAGQTLIVFEQQMIARYTPQLVRLALEIAEKIVGKAVEEDPAITESVLERARREVADAKRLRILLHPADYRALAETAAELVQIGQQRGRQIEVVAAEDVGRGGCRLETEIGEVDATIPVQLDEVRRQLLDE